MITARQYIDPNAAEYHYYSKRVTVADKHGNYPGMIKRHLHTTNDFVVCVHPDNTPDEVEFRINPDNVFLE